MQDHMMDMKWKKTTGIKGGIEMRKINSHVVLTKEDYAKLRPLLKENKITFEPSGYGENIYVAMRVNEKEFEKVNELLKQI